MLKQEGLHLYVSPCSVKQARGLYGILGGASPSENRISCRACSGSPSCQATYNGSFLSLRLVALLGGPRWLIKEQIEKIIL